MPYVIDNNYQKRADQLLTLARRYKWRDLAEHLSTCSPNEAAAVAFYLRDRCEDHEVGAIGRALETGDRWFQTAP